MKLLHEHAQNFYPSVRRGVYLLTLKGEVVYIGRSANIFRSIIQHQDGDIYPFDAFAWVSIPDEDEAAWIESELTELYNPAYNERSH